MTSIPGVDYAWSHPGGAALQAAGKRFACRYLSYDPTKNISRAEADDLAAHDVWSVVVWESTAKRPLDGRAAGAVDARNGAAQATAAGMPSGRPIYFAVDFDAQPAQMPTVLAYLDGAASVLGTARVGVYGGYRTVKAALDGGHAARAWQTIAWSGGRWDPRAVIQQGAQTRIGGVTCDLNTALATDYGQWKPGITPTITPAPEDTMPLTDDEIAKVATKAAEAVRWFKVDDPFTAGGAQTTLGGLWWETATRVGKLIQQPAPPAQPAVALTDAQVAQIAQQVAASPAFATVIGKQIADQVPAIARQVAAELSTRLQS